MSRDDFEKSAKIDTTGLARQVSSRSYGAITA
jgi:hypothetical protein